MSCAAVEIAREMIRFAGTRAWENADVRAAIIAAANEISLGIEDCMAFPDYFKVTTGTSKTLRSSGGTAVLTLSPAGVGLANGAFRQAATLDLGEFWARKWRIDCEFELAATPTAGRTINLHASFKNASGAGDGNTSGSDSAYTGYSSNALASTKQLQVIGHHNCTTQITSTVQKGCAGAFSPNGRYLNLVVENDSGAAFHTSDANCVITFTPLEDAIQDNP